MRFKGYYEKKLSELCNASAVSKKQLIHFLNPDMMNFKLLSLDNDISHFFLPYHFSFMIQPG